MNFMPWYVLYTKPRNEKKVTEKLEQLGFTVYCPLVTVVKQWSDRKKKVLVPLLPSYIFIQIDEVDRSKVFEVTGVVRFLYWLGKPAVIRNEEIDAMQNWLKRTVTSFEVVGIQPGSRFEIPSGPFLGKHGIVTKVEKNHLILVLEELGVKIILNT